LVHPTWWGGQPAILKGWFDRVLGAGVAYRFDRRGRPRSLLRHIRRLVVVTTYGSSPWVNLLEGEPGRRTVRWALRALLSWRARTRWLACYRMDTAGEAERARFLARVERELTAL
jgi:putative NADPH-quinone reductase